MSQALCKSFLLIIFLMILMKFLENSIRRKLQIPREIRTRNLTLKTLKTITLPIGHSVDGSQPPIYNSIVKIKKH